MKKHLSKILILVVFLGLWKIIFSQPSKENQAEKIVEQNSKTLEENEFKSPEEILSSDYEKLVSNLKKENISDATWENVSNFAFSFKDEIVEENAKSYFMTAQNNIPDLKECLDVDFCGMTTSGPDDPYFDEQATPAHQMIRRLLNVIDISLEKNPELITDLNIDMIRDLANSDWKMLQPEATKLLAKYVEQDSVETLVENTSKYTGSSKAEALVSITKGNVGKSKQAVIDEINMTFHQADSDTVISVLEKLPEMNLNEEDKKDTLIRLCRFKESSEQHNWLMIRSLASKIDKNFNTKCEKEII